MKGPQIDVNTEQHHSVFKYKDSVRKDTGVYKITITNEHGSDSAEIDVVVLGKARLNPGFRSQQLAFPKPCIPVDSSCN